MNGVGLSIGFFNLFISLEKEKSFFGWRIELHLRLPDVAFEVPNPTIFSRSIISILPKQLLYTWRRLSGRLFNVSIFS